MRMILLLLVSLCTYTQTTNLQAQVKWMLLGIVLQKENQRPVENMNVCLEDKLSKERICFTTLTDGCFYFSLERDKQYWDSPNESSSRFYLDQQRNLYTRQRYT